jgi:anti-sigma regulatory factor (Ser/Thr protein kinase)
MCLRVPIEDMSGAGEARRTALRFAQVLNFDEDEAGRVALAVTEAGTNIAQHAGHGEVLLRSMAMDASSGLEVLALDRGPGIDNLGACMRDGYSSAGSRGAGLGAIKRLSTSFDIFSAPGKGTALLSRHGARPKRAADSRLIWGAVCLPFDGEEASGDAWAVNEAPGRSTILVVDGIGHGLYAFEAAQDALEIFEGVKGAAPAAIIQTLDQRLRGTRGVVALLVDINWSSREVRHAGLGNISGKLLPNDQKSVGLISLPGTIGQGPQKAREFSHHLPDDGLVVLHSDGLSSHWDLDDYPGLSQKDPSLIAGVLYRDFRHQNDDVVVLVGRERRHHSKKEETA